MPTAEGNLDWRPLADAPHLVAAPVAAATERLPSARVAAIDPGGADLAALPGATVLDLAMG